MWLELFKTCLICLLDVLVSSIWICKASFLLCNCRRLVRDSLMSAEMMLARGGVKGTDSSEVSQSDASKSKSRRPGSSVVVG